MQQQDIADSYAESILGKNTGCEDRNRTSNPGLRGRYRDGRQKQRRNPAIFAGCRPVGPAAGSADCKISPQGPIKGSGGCRIGPFREDQARIT